LEVEINQHINSTYDDYLLIKAQKHHHEMQLVEAANRTSKEHTQIATLEAN